MGVVMNESCSRQKEEVTDPDLSPEETSQKGAKFK